MVRAFFLALVFSATFSSRFVYADDLPKDLKVELNSIAVKLSNALDSKVAWHARVNSALKKPQLSTDELMTLLKDFPIDSNLQNEATQLFLNAPYKKGGPKDYGWDWNKIAYSNKAMLPAWYRLLKRLTSDKKTLSNQHKEIISDQIRGLVSGFPDLGEVRLVLKLLVEITPNWSKKIDPMKRQQLEEIIQSEDLQPRKSVPALENEKILKVIYCGGNSGRKKTAQCTDVIQREVWDYLGKKREAELYLSNRVGRRILLWLNAVE